MTKKLIVFTVSDLNHVLLSKETLLKKNGMCVSHCVHHHTVHTYTGMTFLVNRALLNYLGSKEKHEKENKTENAQSVNTNPTIHTGSIMCLEKCTKNCVKNFT